MDNNTSYYMDKKTLTKIIQEEIVKLLSEEKKHAMYDPKTGKKIMADGEKHQELAKKGYVHFDPKKVIAAIDKEGGAAGLDAIIKHTGADKDLVTYADSEILTTKDKKVNVDKAIRDLNHSNSIDLDEGVRRTIKWMKEYYG